MFLLHLPDKYYHLLQVSLFQIFFNSFFQIRLPQDVSDDVDEDPTGTKALWDRGLLNGATQKASSSVNFHVGEVISSLQKTTLIPGGSESLVYTTISGSVGMLVPFTSNEVITGYYCDVNKRSQRPCLTVAKHLEGIII